MKMHPRYEPLNFEITDKVGGGICRCPDGVSYAVGENPTRAAGVPPQFACVGGVGQKRGVAQDIFHPSSQQFTTSLHAKRIAYCAKPKGFWQTAAEGCDASDFYPYELWCGDCTVVVLPPKKPNHQIRDCLSYCAKLGRTCVNGWKGVTRSLATYARDGKCGLDYNGFDTLNDNSVGCYKVFDGGESDADRRFACQCGDRSEELVDHYEFSASWDGNGLAYPRIGYVSQLTVRPVPDQCLLPHAQSMSQSLSSPMRPCHHVACRICGEVPHAGFAECHFGCAVLTEIHVSTQRVARCWF